MAADSAELAQIARRFAFDGVLSAATALGRGHIHDSYLLTFDAPAGPRRYVLQRINSTVFSDPPAVVRNVERVTRHVRSKLGGVLEPACERRCLTLVDSAGGTGVERDSAGSWWRAYYYIEHSVTHEAIATDEQARSAARAFGAFQRALADLPPPRLAETIPDFHVTPRRLHQLERAIALDACGRVDGTRAESALALSRRPLADALLAQHRAGALPERVVHNDTKLNNVLFDAATDAALCVVDLDTVMPGLAPYDFGDLVRSCALAREDGTDPDGIRLDLELFEALLHGYLEGTGDMLRDAERAALPLACRLITYELAMRFLTDHLEGDRYFRIAHAGQNLERARVQLALMEAMERAEPAMQRLVTRIATRSGNAQPR